MKHFYLWFTPIFIISRVLCELNHQCPDLCCEVCRPCKVHVLVHLPCGHDAQIPCAENTPDYKCQTLVLVTLDCNHVAEKRCFVKQHHVRCKEICKIRRPCGHTCEEYCHIHDDPDHQVVSFIKINKANLLINIRVKMYEIFYFCWENSIIKIIFVITLKFLCVTLLALGLFQLLNTILLVSCGW